MNTSTLKKVTIVAERLLKERLTNLLRSEGATGHTLIAVEGEGSRGLHASDFEGRNVQIDTIVSQATADRILKRIEEEFLENFAVIAYVTEVAVLRRGKFTPDGTNGAVDPGQPGSEPQPGNPES